MNTIIGILIPFIGTSLGAVTVYFVKDKINEKIEKILLGIASGIMFAASIWSLIIPSIEMSSDLLFPWFPAVFGIILGVIFLIFISKITVESLSHIKLGKVLLLIISVTIHNIPEGMAVGVIFAGVLNSNLGLSLNQAIALSIGIAIQNIPEGAIISLPLKSKGISKNKAFILGVLSGIVEPIAAVITLFLVNSVTFILPYLLSFAAGSMIYVVIKELIPESQEGKTDSKYGVISFVIGFLIMLILDASL